ncbi:uncharacterized protein LOC143562222 [Bidens hawaiensis]|uniref:uncharacterized protein LOC143562222 n=1 Tax=Bidens hawaiensis TaxID=980011 RepID=UPI00404AD6FA
MGIKIEAVRDMMLHRFSGVDQKLTAIEQRLKKLIELQNQTGNPTEGGTGLGKNQDEGMMVVIEGGDGGPLHKFGPNKPLQAQISLDGGNQETGNPHEKMCYLTDENMGEEGSDLGKNQDEGKKVVIEGGNGGPPHESGPKEPLQAKISSVGEDPETGYPSKKRLDLADKNSGEEGAECSKNEGYKVETGESGPKKVEIGGGDEFGPKKPLRAEITSNDVDQETHDQIQGPLGGPSFDHQGKYGSPWEASEPCGWVGLYTQHYRTYNPHGSNYSFGKGFCGPAWVGLQETGFGKKNGPSFGSYEFTFKDQFANSSVEDCPKTQIETGLEGFGSKVVNADLTEKGLNFGGQDDIFKDSDVLLQDSLKPDQWAKKDSGPFGKALPSETNNESVSVECDKVFGQSTLVEAKTDPEHGEQMKVGSKPEGSNECQPKTQRCRQKVKKADVAGCVGNISEKYTEKGVKRTNEDAIFKDSLMSNHLGTKDSRTGLSGEKFVKTGQDGIFKTSFKSDQWVTKKSRMGSWNKWSKDSSKPDPWPKKDCGLFGKDIETETNCESSSAECDKGLDWSKLVGAKTDSRHVWGFKRKHPDCSLGDPNDCPVLSGPFTVSERRVDTFTTDEQETFNEIEPIIQSIHRIMHHKGYNDGDPLSADDQTYILENVFNYHPEKAQKMGAGVDYIMVDKHMKGSRCFYVVSIDGRKEDFSYLKCLKNFIKKT